MITKSVKLTLHIGHKVTVPLNFMKVTGRHSPEYPGDVSVMHPETCTAELNYSHTAVIIKALNVGVTDVRYHYDYDNNEVTGVIKVTVEEELHELFDMDHAVYSAVD